MIVSSQSILFLKFACAGLIFALATEILNIFLTLLNKNKVIQFIIDLISCISLSFIYIYLINTLNYGVSRIYLLSALVLAIILEKITIGKLIAKFNNWLYNKLRIGKEKFFKTKFGKYLSK